MADARDDIAKAFQLDKLKRFAETPIPTVKSLWQKAKTKLFGEEPKPQLKPVLKKVAPKKGPSK